MTATSTQTFDAADLSDKAREHLWMHFTRLSSYANSPVPTIVRGEGAYIFDVNGKRYLDGLAGLFVVQAGHGRHELAEAAYRQAQELAFFPLWSYAHPQAIELADRLAAYAPGDLNKVFFTTGGGEAVETAWKMAKHYFKLTGKPMKTKVISRSIAYHGTTHGALSITGIPAAREICDRHNVLLVSDEVICAFGRLGKMFASDKFGYVPDIITCAKGMTSGYSPIGACLVSDRVAAPFWKGDESFPHGYTFGGHPVSSAVANANLDLFEREGLNQHVLDNEAAFRATLEKLTDLPIVGDVRGDGYFYGIELVKDKATKETFDDDESERLLRSFLSKALF